MFYRDFGYLYNLNSMLGPVCWLWKLTLATLEVHMNTDDKV